jgi:hypothetical protein
MDIATHLNQTACTADLQTAAEKLHRKVISSFGTILVTHYFLEQVIPQTGLTPPQAWLVTLLRDRCFTNPQTGEVRDEVLIRGGYPELADWLGIARSKTIWEWIRDGKGAVGAFIAVQPLHAGDEPDALRMKVRLDEPLFDGASDTISMAQMSLADGGDDTINLAQSLFSDGTEKKVLVSTEPAGSMVAASTPMVVLQHKATKEAVQMTLFGEIAPMSSGEKLRRR